MQRIDGKIIEKDNSVYILKYCKEHGEFSSLLEERAAWFYNQKVYSKPGNKFINQTQLQKGCPYDCGLCPSHEQHTCIGLIEVTSSCDLNCPLCFAQSGKHNFLSYSEFNKMLDFFVNSEGGKADILQISGGEPTLHPQILDFILLARSKNIDYVMLNTNGIRIAEDTDFVKELSKLKGGFEVYLQFDGFDDKVYQYFRGKPLSVIKKKAIENLNAFNIPVTLVTTIENGINDSELGKIITYGLNTRCIRGINFQPVAYFGRLPENSFLTNGSGNIVPENRLTISSVIKKIQDQTSRMIRQDDFIPLPCDSDRVAISYFFKEKNSSFVPLTRKIDLKKHLPFIKNTFKFDPDNILKEMASAIFSKECCGAGGFFTDLMKIIPKGYLFWSEQEKIDFVSNNTFRISITSFVDAYNFDIKSAQKECVHFITSDLRKMPFSTFNIFHR